MRSAAIGPRPELDDQTNAFRSHRAEAREHRPTNIPTLATVRGVRSAAIEPRTEVDRREGGELLTDYTHTYSPHGCEGDQPSYRLADEGGRVVSLNQTRATAPSNYRMSIPIPTQNAHPPRCAYHPPLPHHLPIPLSCRHDPFRYVCQGARDRALRAVTTTHIRVPAEWVVPPHARRHRAL